MLIIGLLLSFLQVLFSQNTDKIQSFHINGKAQGTTFHILYYAADSSGIEKDVHRIFSEIDQSMSVYKTNSLISKFNASNRGIEVDRHLKKVVQKSLSIYKKSNGLFDITLHPIIQLWGFGTIPVDTFPDSSQIKEAMNHVGSHKLRLKGNFLFKTDPKVQINVNAIAPGYTSDLIAELLESKGISTYLVEVGGEIRMNGKKPDGSNLRIGIESPSSTNNLPSSSILQTIISMDRGAITTSGNYRQYIERNNKKTTHLLNGKTGFPVENEVIAVTVYAEDAMTADGFDNVLMALGLQESFNFLKKTKGMEAYFIYKDKQGLIKDTATNGFYKLMVQSSNR